LWIASIHNNMPPFGLLAATTAVPATGSRRTARKRMGLPDPRPPEVPQFGPGDPHEPSPTSAHPSPQHGS